MRAPGGQLIPRERKQKLNKAFPVFLLELINAMMLLLRRSKQWGRGEPEESYIHMKSKVRSARGPFPKHPSSFLPAAWPSCHAPGTKPNVKTTRGEIFVNFTY